LLTSAITLGEILVKPLEKGDMAAAANCQKLISTTAVVIPFEEKAALVYSRLRGDRSLRPTDAIQLACVACARVDLFVTNDARLQSKQVDGIQFIVPLDRLPL
jgi:predicted nucleic acid-binding protein